MSPRSASKRTQGKRDQRPEGISQHASTWHGSEPATPYPQPLVMLTG